MEYSTFAVDERPLCAWDWELRKQNLSFIDSVDPGYFEYLAEVHGQALRTKEHQQSAALALRTTYAHGLETLMAVTFAMFQAPECIAGWLHEYRTEELRAVVRKFEKRQDILSRLRFDPFTWEGLAKFVLAYVSSEDKEKEARIVQGFAKAWHRLAKDFLDEDSSLEYNSVKHGLRLKLGGFRLAIGLEKTFGEPAPPENMRSLGGSDFGSTFYLAERIGETGPHFRLKSFSRNWHPESLVIAIQLIAMSLRNMLSFLRIVNGVEPSAVQFQWPREELHFEEPWKVHFAISTVNWNSIITEHDINPLTPEEILKIYNTGSSTA